MSEPFEPGPADITGGPTRDPLDDERESRSDWTPPVEVTSTAEGVMLRFDLPGVRASEIELTIEGRTLTLRGERAERPEPRGQVVLRRETRYGRFLRRMALPESVDGDAIRASCQDGVLEIVAPKRGGAAIQKVTVSGE